MCKLPMGQGPHFIFNLNLHLYFQTHQYLVICSFEKAGPQNNPAGLQTFHQIFSQHSSKDIFSIFGAPEINVFVHLLLAFIELGLPQFSTHHGNKELPLIYFHYEQEIWCAVTLFLKQSST